MAATIRQTLAASLTPTSGRSAKGGKGHVRPSCAVHGSRHSGCSREARPGAGPKTSRPQPAD
jgi:hypothetical protein